MMLNKPREQGKPHGNPPPQNKQEQDIQVKTCKIFGCNLQHYAATNQYSGSSVQKNPESMHVNL